MAKQHTSLPMQSHVVDEKHDHIHGNASLRSPTSVAHGSDNGGAGVLPGGSLNKKQETKVHPVVIIALWISLSMSVIIYNAWILKDKGLGFNYPIFLTTFHMAFSTVGTRLLARYTHLLDGLANVEMTKDRWIKSILPIGFLFSASLALSNYAYLFLSVAYIQMVKAFTPVAVLLISIFFGLKQANPTLLGIVFAISCGVALASYGELDFQMFGFILQVLAILFESSRLVMIQVLLQGLKMDPLVSLYYFAPVCAAMLAIALPIIEGLEPFLQLGKVGPIVLLTNASCAFCLNIASVFLIGAASSLVLTLAGVVKDILLIFGSMFLLGSVVTGPQYLGYAIALAGLVAFKLHKS
ncbi:TPT-domain-containing protein [Tilletiaria anomala UBC 951]|uniref:TPT-domain-containing protein n=1 Tax=Tilletiaria anomala (strain ATCC 24038 / CBS 436.72 / UBC 951) TaxID=1037660 RepID=A0A066WA92_TILAU|nr:TPT-domain-containing protein [Tilletiaria anomala UBC 951]KDN50837.1 TPT-domain-containing protein [Tilletiaria anomala UBC 951]